MAKKAAAAPAKATKVAKAAPAAKAAKAAKPAATVTLKHIAATLAEEHEMSKKAAENVIN